MVRIVIESPYGLSMKIQTSGSDPWCVSYRTRDYGDIPFYFNTPMVIFGFGDISTHGMFCLRIFWGWGKRGKYPQENSEFQA